MDPMGYGCWSATIEIPTFSWLQLRPRSTGFFRVQPFKTQTKRSLPALTRNRQLLVTTSLGNDGVGYRSDTLSNQIGTIAVMSTCGNVGWCHSELHTIWSFTGKSMDWTLRDERHISLTWSYAANVLDHFFPSSPFGLDDRCSRGQPF